MTDAKTTTKKTTKKSTEPKEPEAGSSVKTEDGKVKTYHGAGLYSIDN